MRFRRTCWVTLGLAVALAAAGCGGDEADGKATASRATELAALRSQKDALAARRGEIESLRAQATAAGAGGSALAGQVEQADQAVAELADRYGAALVDFINADPPIQGEPVSEDVKAAIHLKVEEDMLVAREYIEQGGNYARAIDIYEGLASLDPDNAALAAETARAKDMRFMKPDRFARIKDGMSQPEVRGLLGPVNLYNVREYQDRGVISWLYPKEEGGAAGVFFQKDRRGDLVVYETDFNAVKKQE